VKLFSTLWRRAYCPLTSEARLGEQRDVVTKVFANRAPSVAIRSRLGVLNQGNSALAALLPLRHPHGVPAHVVGENHEDIRPGSDWCSLAFLKRQ